MNNPLGNRNSQLPNLHQGTINPKVTHTLTQTLNCDALKSNNFLFKLQQFMKLSIKTVIF